MRGRCGRAPAKQLLARHGHKPHLRGLSMSTTSGVYRAPFAPGNSIGIDADVCRKLLDVALSRGGDYADLFFEYCASGGLSFEEGITRSASRGTSVGLGVRV